MKFVYVLGIVFISLVLDGCNTIKPKIHFLKSDLAQINSSDKLEAKNNNWNTGKKRNVLVDLSSDFTKIIFSDQFEDNRNNWKTEKNHNFQVDIHNGVFHFEKLARNRESNGCLWYSKKIDNLQTDKDFMISFDARFLSADDVCNEIDFQWGNLNEELYQLIFSVDGNILLNKFSRNNNPQRWSRIVTVIENGLIHSNRFNKIVIMQVQNRCIIGINNKEVVNTEIERISGNAIGIQQCLKVSWDMDNIEIRTKK